MREKSKKSLSDVAYTALKKKIVTTGGGSYLSARQFATEIGMSYTPVREAFLRLQKEGTLRLVPNVGFFVDSLDIGELIQIFQVRECTEIFVLEKVFERITPEHIAQMKKINDQLCETLSQKNIYEYQQLDIKLHEIIFKLYGNKHLLQFYQNIRERYTICSKRVASHLSNEAILEHSDYIASLESGNKEKAIADLKKNLTGARERMVEGYINVVNQST
jgi:GntR family transcriptional regulator, rspAB operon transcriptional repressor